MKLTAGSSALNFWDDENAFTAGDAPSFPPQLISVSLDRQTFPTVLIPQRQSAISSLRKLDAVLVVSVTLLCIAAPLVPANAAIGAAVGTAVLAVLAFQAVSGSRAGFDLLRHLLWLSLVRRAVFSGPLSSWSAWLRGSRAGCSVAAGNSHMGSLGIL